MEKESGLVCFSLGCGENLRMKGESKDQVRKVTWV